MGKEHGESALAYWLWVTAGSGAHHFLLLRPGRELSLALRLIAREAGSCSSVPKGAENGEWFFLFVCLWLFLVDS